MLFERLKPLAPPAHKIAWDATETWYHNYKNLTTETLRADCQWWSKFLAFALVIAGLT